MKPEPLTKEKIIGVVENIHSKSHGIIQDYVSCFYYKDVKSAVDLVLKEIEEEIKEYTVSASDVAFIQDKWKCDGIVRGLEIARGKIKKAFSGVLEK